VVKGFDEEKKRAGCVGSPEEAVWWGCHFVENRFGVVQEDRVKWVKGKIPPPKRARGSWR